MTQLTREQKDSLVKLGDSDIVLSDPADDIRHRKVIDSETKAVGHVSALFIDERLRKVRFMEVTAGGFLGLGGQKFMVPVEDISSIDSAEIHVHHTLGKILEAPRYDPSLTSWYNRAFWNPYYDYYGYSPYWI